MFIITLLFKSIREYFSFNDCLYFGAIISATDPVTVLAIFNDQKVNVNLYALVFGESVLNDAVSIILAQAIERYSGSASSDTFDIKQFFLCIYDFFAVFIGAFGIGSSMGCLTALLTKYTYIRQHSELETALFILMSYSTFLAAEALGFTGIVSVLFCGIFQAHYTFNNLSKESQTQTKQIFNLLNFISENFIFIYIGITMFTFNSHQWEFLFIIPSLIAIIIARAVNIYPLSFLINLSRSPKSKVEKNMQHLMVFSGLRGAMAFALAIRNTSTKARKLILTTTSVIVILTVIICGGLTSKMLSWLGITTSPLEDENAPNNPIVDLGGYHSDYPSDSEAPSTSGRCVKAQSVLSKFGIFKAWHSFDKKLG